MSEPKKVEIVHVDGVLKLGAGDSKSTPIWIIGKHGGDCKMYLNADECRRVSNFLLGEIDAMSERAAYVAEKPTPLTELRLFGRLPNFIHGVDYRCELETGKVIEWRGESCGVTISRVKSASDCMFSIQVAGMIIDRGWRGTAEDCIDAVEIRIATLATSITEFTRNKESE